MTKKKEKSAAANGRKTKQKRGGNTYEGEYPPDHPVYESEASITAFCRDETPKRRKPNQGPDKTRSENPKEGV